MALGVAFFSGIQAASPDMRFSGDAYYDSSKLMDLKVVGTLGLTEADVQALEEVDGIQSAEGAYAADVLCGEESSRKVLHIESLNETVNQITATEGRLPEKSGECFLDSAFAGNEGYQIGDSISFRQEEDSELLKKDIYTIVGIGSSPFIFLLTEEIRRLVPEKSMVLPMCFRRILTRRYIRRFICGCMARKG